MRLESDPDSELELPHANGRTRGGIRFDVRDLAGAAAAVHAGVAGDGENRVVEHVVGIEPELCLDTLGDGEILRERDVIVEGVRTAIGIETDIADLAASGKHERTGSRTCRLAGIACTTNIRGRVRDFRKRLTERRDWGEPEGAVGIVSDTRIQSSGSLVWTARAGVRNLTAILKAGRPWQARPVGRSVRYLPTANHQVRQAAGIAHKCLASADRQFVNDVGHKDLISVVRIWSPGDGFVHVEVRRVVGIRV